jgi:hypothetical protein
MSDYISLGVVRFDGDWTFETKLLPSERLNPSFSNKFIFSLLMAYVSKEQ